MIHSYLYTCIYWIRHGDSTRWQGMKQDQHPNFFHPFIIHPADERLYHTTRVYAPYSLRTAVWVLLRPIRIRPGKELWDGAYGLIRED